MLYKKLTDLIPGAEGSAVPYQSPHERIHHEPAREDDDETDCHIYEYLFRTRYLTTRDTREIEPSRPREEYGG